MDGLRCYNTKLIEDVDILEEKVWLEQSKLATVCFGLALASSPSGSYLWKCPARRSHPFSSFTFCEIVWLEKDPFGIAYRP